VILGGRLHSGIHSMAGEIGHWIVEPNGPRCACGAQGCLEMVAAGPAIARRAQEAANGSSATRLRGQAPLTARDVYQIAGEGDAVAQAIVQQASGYLARALYQVILAYDVECVVLGGGVAHAGRAFLAPILGELERLGSESDLARMLLPPDRFALLPDGYEAGTWGGVALARDFHRRNSMALSGSKG
jgi:glucokinase